MPKAKLEGGGGTVMIEGSDGRRTYITLEEAEAVRDLLSPGATAVSDAQRHLDIHQNVARWPTETPNPGTGAGTGVFAPKTGAVFG